MNPVALLNDKLDKSNAKRFIGNAQLNYKVHGFEDLSLNLNLGLDWSSQTVRLMSLPARKCHSTTPRSPVPVITTTIPR